MLHHIDNRCTYVPDNLVLTDFTSGFYNTISFKKELSENRSIACQSQLWASSLGNFHLQDSIRGGTPQLWVSIEFSRRSPSHLMKPF